MYGLMMCGSLSDNGKKGNDISEYDICTQARYWEDSSYLDYMKMHGKHFSKKMANYATSGLVNNDGTTGPHWTCPEVSEALSELGYTLSADMKYDAYYLANQGYSDYYGTSMPTVNNVMLYVIDVIEDKDGYEGMAFSIYLTKCMSKCISLDFNDLI